MKGIFSTFVTVATVSAMLSAVAKPVLAQRYGETLLSTVFIVTPLGDEPSASCSAYGCTALAPAFPPASVKCPLPAGKTCTFYVTVLTTLSGTGQDSLISASADNIKVGPAQWFVSGFPYVGPIAPFGPQNVEYSFVTTAKNTFANQAHHVEVDLMCTDAEETGSCYLAVTPPNVRYVQPTTTRVDVFAP